MNLLNKVLADRNFELHAADAIQRMLDEEMQKPEAERDYDRIAVLSRDCCKLMGKRKDAEHLAAHGIRTVKRRIAHKEFPEELTETFTVEQQTSAEWYRSFLAAAACVMLCVGFAGGAYLLRRPADSILHVQITEEETTEETTMATAVTVVETVNVTLPAVVTIIDTQATDLPEPVVSPDVTAVQAPATQAAPPAETEKRTQAVPAATETVTETVIPPTDAPETTEAPANPYELGEIPGYAISQWEENGVQYACILPQEAESAATRIKLRYSLGWIPEGYEFLNSETDPSAEYGRRVTTYTSASGSLILTQRTRNAPGLEPFETRFRTEDYAVTPVNIGQYPGWLAVSRTYEGDCTLTWDVGEYLFTLSGSDTAALQRAAIELKVG